jgi:hypothetical protein
MRDWITIEAEISWRFSVPVLLTDPSLVFQIGV